MGPVRAQPHMAWVVVATAALAFVLSSGSDASGLPRRPDVLLIVTDGQRPDTLDWMPIVRRRVVDRGRRFTNGMVPTSVCCPSRASILTGLFAHTTHVWSNGRSGDLEGTGGWPAFAAAGMEDRTIAVALQARGYQTMLVGKYLNRYDASPEGYVPPGWTSWHAFAGTNGDYYDYEIRHTDGSTTAFGHREEDYSTDVLLRYALREVRIARSNRPLFLMFTPFGVHGGLPEPAPRHLGTATVGPYEGPSVNEADVSDKPAWIAALSTISTRRLSRQSRTTQEALSSIDEAVGRLLDVIHDRRRLRNTLVIVTSDNGQFWGEHRLGGKYMPYDGATRVPLAMRWGGRIRAGTVDRRLALNLDITTTIASAARLDSFAADGLSLLDPDQRDGFVLEAAATSGGDGNGQRVARPGYCGFRTRRFLFVRYPAGVEELYDYRHDPWELDNVAGLDAYASQLAALRDRADADCRPRPPGYDW
jgi:N-acetylglucosamine-6-sulfatase